MVSVNHDMVVAAVDVGAVANIGWWRIAAASAGGGTDLDELVGWLVEDLNCGRPVALGFEAPLYLPVPASVAGIGRQRVGEKGRPWCAGPGPTAMVYGLQETGYVMRGIRRGLTGDIRVGFDAGAFLAGRIDLLVWEAFVTGVAKDPDAQDRHVADARTAVREFAVRAATGEVCSDVEGGEVLNLAGAAVIAAGLSADPALLATSCVVVRPETYRQLGHRSENNLG